MTQGRWNVAPVRTVRSEPDMQALWDVDIVHLNPLPLEPHRTCRVLVDMEAI